MSLYFLYLNLIIIWGHLLWIHMVSLKFVIDLRNLIFNHTNCVSRSHNWGQSRWLYGLRNQHLLNWLTFIKNQVWWLALNMRLIFRGAHYFPEIEFHPLIQLIWLNESLILLSGIMSRINSFWESVIKSTLIN